MANVAPLKLGLVRSEWADEVPSPPHDALSPAQRRAHVGKHPLSYLGVTRAPEDVDPGMGTSPDQLLLEGRAQLDRLLAANVFEFEAAATYFLYRLDAPDHQQSGVVCGVAVDDYDSGMVRIHERIRTARSVHLARHLGVVGAQSSPIAFGVSTSASLEAVLGAEPSAEPLVEVQGNDGIRQRIWRIENEATVAQIDAEIGSEPLYLIDGHHRAAAASTYRSGLVPDSVPATANWMLSVVFPLGQLRNQAFHRVLQAVDPTELQALLSATFTTRLAGSLEEVANREPSELAIALPASSTVPGWHNDDAVVWLLVEVPMVETGEGAAADAMANLDPVRLNRSILRPLLEIDESDAGGALRYEPGFGHPDALDALRPAADEAIVVMREVSMEVLVTTSDAGLVMPPKSTFFEPKVRSGLFLHRKAVEQADA